MPARPSRSSTRFPRQRRRGSVVLFVLGVILLTSFLLTRLIDRAAGELLAETKAASRTALRDQAYSALEVTLAVLADVSANDNGLHSPQQGWSDPLDYAGYEPPAGYKIAVSFDDETGKLPLASTSDTVLQHYLETIGATTIQAERVADALLGWTKSDYIPSFSEADPRTYENSVLPYAPPHRALGTFEELRAVAVVRDLFFDADGRWTELGDRFRADASLFSFSKVNINTARPSVLVAMGVNNAQAVALTDELTGADPTRAPKFYRSMGEAAAEHGAELSQFGFGADVQCLRVRVLVRRGATVFSLEAVVKPGNSSSQRTVTAAKSDTKTDPTAPLATPVDARALTRKSIDYPFSILELRETDGPVS